MSVTRKIRRALRGEVGLRPALLEAGRRTLVALRRRRERAALGALSRVERGPARARLAPEFARLGGAELLEHFRTRTTPRLPAGFEEAETGSAGSCLARNVEGILKEARAVAAHRWPLLGYGVREFGARVDWLREPASGVEWPLDFHADVQLVRGGGSDVRVLWELNRLGHLVTLARAYAAGGGEGLAEEFFAQVETWAARGYHRFALELFLYTFVLCRENGIEIEERHFLRVRSMLEYLRAYLRPDGRAPLVGDTDGGRFLPLVWRAADDHAYLLAVGAAVFREPRFKLPGGAPEEVFWLTGAGGLQTYEGLEAAALSSSASEVFEHAGACVLREGDLYLMLNASGAGLAGRGAHGHNDALSIEVSACGVSFISDPGTYVYTGDPRARHEFRSTAYHSTVGVDGAEQNTISVDTPFIIGDEARPRVLAFYSDGGRATTCAEHVGYERLAAGPVTHRRSVHFDGRGRFWLVRDSLIDEGEHEHEQEYEHGHDFRFVFHAAPGRLVRTLDARGAGVPDGCAVEVADAATGARLLVVSLEGLGGVAVEPRWASREYGSRVETAAAVWTTRAPVPLVASWLLVPVCAGEEAAARLELALKSVAELMDESGESGG
ncbi:MAG: heparinase II/III family protein [Acidobacteria bacterium]|nr:heparinase II/III family protein [Acidobacteriota bacterium]